MIQQKVSLLADFPSSTCEIIRPKKMLRDKKSQPKMVWKGTLQPTLLSQVYKLRVELPQDSFPYTYLDSPRLEKVNDEKPPHLYSYQRQRLCLYLPKAKDWTKSEYISKTIIPWASEWLFFYEIWLATGVWQGGGAHPEKKEVG